MIVIATDVLAEGLNLQDCDKIINYDLHWNPVKLIQRFGRIDRIGSEYEKIYGINFLPETGIERNLKLQEKLRCRIQEIHDTIGEDSAILDPTERLNEEAMYAIYEKNSAKLAEFEDVEEDILDLNEAEEILRQLKKENKSEYERIANLRDGIRTVRPSDEKGLFVFCEAGRYQKLYLLDKNMNIISTDIPKILGVIKCGHDIEGLPIPEGYNRMVMGVLRKFREEVKHREAEKEHIFYLSHGQRYIIRELRSFFRIIDDDNIKAKINLLEKAFRGAIPKAVDRELNKIRRNGITGENLVRLLSELYNQFGMRDWLDRKLFKEKEQAIPKIICSEGLY